jgi:hypothetical protein
VNARILVGRLVIASLFLFAAAGCTEAIADGSDAPVCEGRPTQPVTKAQLEQVLKEQGYRMYEDRESGSCSAVDIEVLLVNLPVSDADIAAGDDKSKIMERYGHVICDLRRAPLSLKPGLHRDLDAPAASPIFNGPKAKFWIANAACTIYPDDGGDYSVDSQVRRLERAMEELERLIQS